MTHSVGQHLVLANISAIMVFMKEKIHQKCGSFSYLWHLPYDDRPICASRNDEFAAWAETTGDDAGRMCNSNANLNGRLIVPQLRSPK